MNIIFVEELNEAHTYKVTAQAHLEKGRNAEAGQDCGRAERAHARAVQELQANWSESAHQQVFDLGIELECIRTAIQKANTTEAG
jgi:hypothetical protein